MATIQMLGVSNRKIQLLQIISVTLLVLFKFAE